MSGKNNPMFGRKHKPETIEIFKRINRGKNNPFYGKQWSDKNKKYLSDKYKGSGNPFFGRKHSYKTRKKISKKIKSNPPFKGRHHTEKAKQIFRESRMKTIIPNKDSKPEILLQECLTKNGFVFQKHRQDIFGYPDIFIEPNICVFVDGCYWHFCQNKLCVNGKNSKEPTERQNRSISRDKEVNKTLKKLNYKVIRFWQHSIEKNVQKCVYKIH